MKERFEFAKKVIASRKKIVAAQGVDEHAVLAFDTETRVHITRKPRKGKSQLWKVET
jgi:hypothetical protein